ncbi:MAG: PEGA domain-containing protein [Polyangiaceae bacterium]|nr:PEGA domain-containing protein [Polyangiaceae bacterium]
MGDTELRLGLHRDAAEHLTAMIAMYPPDEDKQTLSDAKAMLEKAKAKIGTVTLASNVQGADVSVNGTVIGKTPCATPSTSTPDPQHRGEEGGLRLEVSSGRVRSGQSRADRRNARGREHRWCPAASRPQEDRTPGPQEGQRGQEPGPGSGASPE